jgi:hypothetical protein
VDVFGTEKFAATARKQISDKNIKHTYPFNLLIWQLLVSKLRDKPLSEM